MLVRVEEERELTGGMKLLQQAFVSEFLSSQEKWQIVTGTQIARGKDLDWYLTDGALGWHMKGASSRPLIQDDQACSWLQHASPQVVASAVKAIPVKEQTALAEALAEAGKLEQAVRILVNLVEVCDLSLPELQAYTIRLFEFSDRIPLAAKSEKCAKHEATAGNRYRCTGRGGGRAGASRGTGGGTGIGAGS